MLRPIAFYADFLLYFLPLSHIEESSGSPATIRKSYSSYRKFHELTSLYNASAQFSSG